MKILNRWKYFDHNTLVSTLTSTGADRWPIPPNFIMRYTYINTLNSFIFNQWRYQYWFLKKNKNVFYTVLDSTTLVLNIAASLCLTILPLIWGCIACLLCFGKKENEDRSCANACCSLYSFFYALGGKYCFQNTYQFWFNLLKNSLQGKLIY